MSALCVLCLRTCLLCAQDYEDDFEVFDGADDCGADEPKEGEAAEELPPARPRVALCGAGPASRCTSQLRQRDKQSTGVVQRDPTRQGTE